MPKKRKKSKTKSKVEGNKSSKTVPDTTFDTFDDPLLLYKNYTKHCEIIGLAAHDSVRATLCDAENNPNNGIQILIGSKEGNDTDNNIAPLGPGGCRALVMAILGGKYRDASITDTTRNKEPSSDSQQQVF